MKFKSKIKTGYPEYLVQIMTGNDWYKALGKGVPLGNHFTIDKNGKTHHFDGNGNPRTAKDLADSPNIASWEKQYDITINKVPRDDVSINNS